MLFLFKCFVPPLTPTLASRVRRVTRISGRSGPCGPRAAAAAAAEDQERPAGLGAPLEKGRLEENLGCPREGATATGGPPGRDSLPGEGKQGPAHRSAGRASSGDVAERLSEGQGGRGEVGRLSPSRTPIHRQAPLRLAQSYVRGSVSSASSLFPATLHPQTPPYADARTWGGSE